MQQLLQLQRAVARATAATAAPTASCSARCYSCYTASINTCTYSKYLICWSVISGQKLNSSYIQYGDLYITTVIECSCKKVHSELIACLIDVIIMLIQHAQHLTQLRVRLYLYFHDKNKSRTYLEVQLEYGGSTRWTNYLVASAPLHYSVARKITIYRLSARIAGIASVLDLDLLYSSAHYEQQNVSISTPLVCRR